MPTGGLAKPPLTWSAYLADVLPSILSGAGLTSGRVTDVVADIRVRAEGYAAGGPPARRALRVPFLDDVVDFEPAEAPAAVRADAAVVVRNSLLEEDHSAGLVTDNHLFDVTFLACAPLNIWLRDNLNTEEHDPPAGPFAALVDFPRAYTALQALAKAAENGGRVAFKSPKDAAAPALPTANEVDVERTAAGFIKRSATSALDSSLVEMLQAVATGELRTLVASSLSRYSRDSELLAHVIEVALAHDASVLTTNFLIRPAEVFARKPPFAKSHSREPFLGIDYRGLSGLHAKYLRGALAQIELQPPTP